MPVTVRLTITVTPRRSSARTALRDSETGNEPSTWSVASTSRIRARPGSIDLKSCRNVSLGQFSDLAGYLDAGRTSTHHHEGQFRGIDRGVVAQLGPLERGKHAGAHRQRALQ